jgi:hypothetical protein
MIVKNKKYLLTLVLFVLLAFLLIRARNSRLGVDSLVYKESLDEVAVVVGDSQLTLRDMAFYVAYEESEVEETAELYDSENPENYWNARVEGGFVRVLARNAAMQMAIHDEIFYRMALAEELELTTEETQQAELVMQDFWSDLQDRDGQEKLGVTREELDTTVRKIALAQKYQDIYAQMNDQSYDDYDYTADAYLTLRDKQEYTIKENVWKRVGIGSVTLEH